MEDFFFTGDPHGSTLGPLLLKLLLCRPNFVIVGIVVDRTISKAGNTGKATEFLRLMENGDTKPNTIVYLLVKLNLKSLKFTTSNDQYIIPVAILSS